MDENGFLQNIFNIIITLKIIIVLNLRKFRVYEEIKQRTHNLYRDFKGTIYFK